MARVCKGISCLAARPSLFGGRCPQESARLQQRWVFVGAQVNQRANASAPVALRSGFYTQPQKLDGSGMVDNNMIPSVDRLQRWRVSSASFEPATALSRESSPW